MRFTCIPKLVLFLLAVNLLGCSGGEDKGPELSLSAENAFCPSGDGTLEVVPDILRIENYRIVISGEGFDPIEVIVPGNASSTPVQNIPKGDNRTLLVEALNKNGQIVCRRELKGISIEGGKFSPVDISLLAVPFVMNLSNGNLVTQTRLTFRGFGEPNGAVEILDFFQGTETVLIDKDTSSDLVSPSEVDASFFFRPAVLPLGEHTFTIRDSQTGEKSQVTVTLVRPGRFPGSGVNVAGLIQTTESTSVGMLGPFTEVLEALAQ